jgi:mannose-1-phosphate guanylyltransferase/phosphomannomutase
MSKIANYISPEIASYQTIKNVNSDLVQKFKEETQVVLMAGGFGARFAEIEGAGEINKLAYELPTGDTIIETTIKMFRDSGLKNFLCLVYHKSESIFDVLGDGSELGVNIKYSIDPPGDYRKVGAILNAIQNGSIDKEKPMIMHNPDDLIMDFPDFIDYIIKAHIESEHVNKTIATIINADAVEIPFSVMAVKDSIVTTIEKNCLLPIPTHMGTLIFSKEIFGHFDKIFDFKRQHHFENELFPYLVKNKLFGATAIPYNSWYPVNDKKSLERLINRLNS